MMKVKFLNVVRRSGRSAKTGNDYDMCFFQYLIPLKTGKFGSMTVVGFGDEVKEIRCSHDVINMCTDIPACSFVELGLSPDIDYPEKNIVSSVKSLLKKAA